MKTIEYRGDVSEQDRQIYQVLCLNSYKELNSTRSCLHSPTFVNVPKHQSALSEQDRQIFQVAASVHSYRSVQSQYGIIVSLPRRQYNIMQFLSKWVRDRRDVV